MSNTRKYWNSLEQYNNDPEFVAKAEREFAEDLPVDEFIGNEDISKSSTSRRDFLKFVGFSVAAASLAACETPVVKSIPYVVKPEEVTPGVANYYASTYADGNEYCSILVKTREGRPIHIEGNKLSNVTNGAVSARVNSSVLSLYDSERLQGPTKGGEQTDWTSIDNAVKSQLQTIKDKGGKIRVLTNSIMSPSTKAAIGKMAEVYGGEGGADVQHVSYDAYSYAGMIQANEASFGKAMIPDYKFENAKTIVSFGADFLGNWLSSLEYQNAYATRRNPDGAWMSRHYQFESNFSLTGTNADVRGAILPSDQMSAIIMLHNAVATKLGKPTIVKAGIKSDDNSVSQKLVDATKDLVSSKGHALVIANSNDKNVQIVVNAINEMLGSYGSTIDMSTPVHLKQANDTDFAGLVKEMNSGSVDALFVYGVNPVYSSPAALKFEAAMKKVKFSVAFADRLHETASLCTINATDNHFLESWNDFNPKGMEYSIAQPTISPLFDTRQAQESFLTWSGETQSYYDFMKSNWETSIFPNQSKYTFFEAFWNSAVHDGVTTLNKASEEVAEEMTFAADVDGAARASLKVDKPGGVEVEFYLSTAMGEGQQANNPWLQELPDPVSKVTWDNYVAMNPADMEGKYNTKLGEQLPATVAKVTINGATIEMPVVAIPGQKVGAVSIALGYGRTKAGKVVAQGDSMSGESSTIGTNVFPYVGVNGTMNYTASGVTIEPAGKEYTIASTQTHHTMMGRKIVNETSLKTYKAEKKIVWNPDHVIADAYGKATSIKDLDLWNDHDIALGHRWGMSIDLNTCFGCGACITACHSENNVPVVGKDEVRRTRTMSWLRIDRYYTSDMTKAKAKEEGLGAIDMYGKMENPENYPEVVHQPLMCQHCNHAPCETVCPVAATTHSNEGLNQMTYNRCIGTRYCANNCPYKVRRFNWFNYVGDRKFTEVNPSQDDLSRMVLNPDVVVRARGVMEKCSFCVQRIQSGKLTAKKAGRPVEDGEVTSACAAACSVGAIKFGDLNDAKMNVAQDAKHDRAYNLIEEVGTKPNVYYMTKVRNVDETRISEAVAGKGKEVHVADDHGHGHEESHDDHGHDTHSH